MNQNDQSLKQTSSKAFKISSQKSKEEERCRSEYLNQNFKSHIFFDFQWN